MDFGNTIRELTDQKRFKDRLGNPDYLTDVGTNPRYPRLVGGWKGNIKDRLVVLVKVTPAHRAAEFRDWLTLSPAELRSALRPPEGYHYWGAQVGELPEGGPWWIALWDIKALIERGDKLFEKWDNDEGGQFYRVNPRSVPPELRPTTLDLRQLELGISDEPPAFANRDAGRQPERRAELVESIDAAFGVIGRALFDTDSRTLTGIDVTRWSDNMKIIKDRLKVIEGWRRRQQESGLTAGTRR